MRIRCTYYGCTNWASNAYCYEHAAFRDSGGGGLMTLFVGVGMGLIIGTLLAAWLR